ncbi:EAL domain-containing protein [Natronospirillum operosum]|uniref:cyclic-guanylate-specific phosphodiesterase n=1 Tax=Natronospirillum operosum TaxID=2759953 RepID=A0A4Z0WDK9_9GAMM|nr:EAL domain-containing protein [Natronospirillum operosum]TGG93236.1 EAL domain-containing protein [Natronospirillum operosum]
MGTKKRIQASKHSATGKFALPQSVKARMQLYEGALNATSTAVCIALADAEQDDPIIYVNPAFESITGYNREQVLGRNCRFLQGNDRDQPSLDLVRKALREHCSCRAVLRNYRQNGDLFWNRIYISPIRTEAETISHFIAVCEDITLQKVAETRASVARSEAQFRATHDTLTGLPNRYLLRDRLQTALDNAHRTAEPLAVVDIHIDRFSAINAELGYVIGDQILLALAERLRQHLGAATTLGRQGGDEFLLVAPGVPDETALSAWCLTLNELIMKRLAVKPDLRLSASIGAHLVTNAELTADEVLRRVEQAAERAKREGRNSHTLYHPDIDSQPDYQLVLRSEIFDAIQEGQFLLHYQPQMSCRTQQILGVEALARWRHPKRGLLAPQDFIQIAEDSGHIVALGEWVLRTACNQLREWVRLGLNPGSVAVNVSATQLSRESFTDSVHQALEDSGLRPDLLELELTESIMFSDASVTLDKLNALKKLGVRLSIDDFGTGYSSLSYLKKLPIDRLKIDKSFISGLPDDQHDSAIVRTIIAMARNLNLEVVAEGVETLPQLNFLSRHFCDQAQGYYFSPPIAAEGIYALLLEKQQKRAGGKDDQPTLLLVDDEDNVLSALQRLFRHEPLRILTAGSAEEATVILAEETVEVILTDHAMPGSSGIELLRHVESQQPDIVRLLLTGYSNPALIASGIDDIAVYKCLTKPWRDDELLDTVRQAFQLHQDKSDP